jgi:hypothetical protein
LNLERWFSASVLRKLDRLATALRRLPTSPEKRFLEACFSATILRVSLTDPTISVPVRLNPSKSSLTKSQRGERRQWLKHRLEADVTAEFLAVVQLNIGRMGRLYDHLSASSSSVAIGYDSRATTTTPIDLVITSPPYGSAQKYIRASSLALQWLGLAPNGLRDLERQSIGREHFNSDELQSEIPLMTSSQRSIQLIARTNPLRAHIIATFLAEMRDALAAIIRCLRPDGHLVLVVGNNFVCGSIFHTQKYLTQICEGLGLEVRLALVDRIRSRGLITKRNGAPGIISEEWIVIFRKQ